VYVMPDMLDAGPGRPQNATWAAMLQL